MCDNVPKIGIIIKYFMKFNKEQIWILAQIELTGRCLLLPALVHEHMLWQQHKLILSRLSHHCYLCHVIAHFGKIISMRPYIMKWRQNCVCPFADRSVYMLTFKQKSLQLLNLALRFWWRFLRRSRRNFLKNWSRFLRMI